MLTRRFAFHTRIIMNKIILSLLFVAATSSVYAAKKKAPAAKKPAAAAATIKSLPLGSNLPVVGQMLQSVDGRFLTLADERRKNGLIVMFSCNTCPYVQKAKGKTMEVMHEATNLNFGMVIVNSNEAQRYVDDSKERMLEFSRINNYTVPYVIDEQSRLADAFGATRTPEVFLFNSEGKLVYKGALEDNPSDPNQSEHRYVAEAMHALAEGKPIVVKETKSVGCSIKRRAL
jgi:thioredoxin-related protein